MQGFLVSGKVLSSPESPEIRLKLPSLQEHLVPPPPEARPSPKCCPRRRQELAEPPNNIVAARTVAILCSNVQKGASNSLTCQLWGRHCPHNHNTPSARQSQVKWPDYSGARWRAELEIHLPSFPATLALYPPTQPEQWYPGPCDLPACTVAIASGPLRHTGQPGVGPPAFQ